LEAGVSSDAVLRLIQDRGAELVRRAEQLEEWQRAGEGTSAAVQQALIVDEMASLKRIAEAVVHQLEMGLVERRCERVAARLGIEW
jgi:hypothetical protein